jgi:hypothetical protein
MPKAQTWRGLVLGCLLLGVAGEAQAQAYVAPMCRGLVSDANLRFDTAEHARWYKRFWTGQCDHLLACFPGDPNWNDIAGKLVARGSPAERPALQPKVCSLGQRIGFEWSREHGVRHVTTADLRRYHSILDHDGDALRGVTTVEVAVEADLKRPPPR